MVLPYRDVVHYWMLLPATAIILLLSFLEKRKCRTNICCGRPAYIIPIPSLDSYENRLAYAVAFGVTLISTILALFIGPTSSTDRSVWFRAFYSLLQAMIICVVFFPCFACISTRFRAAGAIINIIYCSAWFGMDVDDCVEDVKLFSNDEFLNKPSFKTVIVLIYVPAFVCQLVLKFYCIYIIYRCARSKSFVTPRIPGAAVRPHQVEHVRWVFRKSRDKIYQASLTESQTSFVACMNKNTKLKLFTSLPFFKYPTKMVYLVFIQLITTYMISIIAIYYLVFFNALEDTIPDNFKKFIELLTRRFLIRILPKHLVKLLKEFILSVSIEISNLVTLPDILVELMEILEASVTIALVYTVVLTLFNIMMFTRNYRYHMLKLYQGDKAFISDWQHSSSSKLTSSINCVGYVIIFSIWSFFLGFIAVSLIVLIVIGIFYIAVKLDTIGSLIEKLATIVCILIIGQLFRLVMYLLSKKYLLQGKLQEKDKDLPLNVNNRKLFEILSYFYLYLGIAGGIMSCLRRFLLSAAFGFFSLGRLDKSIYSRDLQKFDGAYATYVAMLQVDNAHNNPSMRLFVHLLWSEVLITRLRSSGRTNTELAQLIDILIHVIEDPNSIKSQKLTSGVHFVSEDVDKKSKLSRTRWFLAYTLLNNPQLKVYRRKELPHYNGEGMQLQIITTNPSFDYSTLT